MKKIVLSTFILITTFAKAQKIESIHINLYTDSLKKGTYNYINVDEVKIFDDEIAYKTPLLCGDKVKFMAKITRLSDGAVLYDSVEKGRQLI